MTDESDDGVRTWLVERTYSDDEQNLVILTYATPDGRRYFRKERALTSFSDARETEVSVLADPKNLGPVDDPEQVEWFSTEASRMAAKHDPGDVL
ncbi:hypothetical protein G9C85_16065 [Halorubellus sp. JP-L1]|uniref:hypothetical protein n=1 Tax=Halorubellus sp. JP-L1 TaxID=2715753 RepID=UPI00140BD791|nr:hypothetical protein [Halorubellus sp. JP-L1]